MALSPTNDHFSGIVLTALSFLAAATRKLGMHESRIRLPVAVPVSLLLRFPDGVTHEAAHTLRRPEKKKRKTRFESRYINIMIQNIYYSDDTTMFVSVRVGPITSVWPVYRSIGRQLLNHVVETLLHRTPCSKGISVCISMLRQRASATHAQAREE
ncbi:hypothetical protein HL42_5301 [Trichophyton rubrum]|nr:hypothetical protein HL42_5301 [Trichophyton rubrum]